MPAPLPKTIADEIGAQIGQLLLYGGHLVESTSPTWVALWDACQKLQGVDVSAASVLKAELFTISGDIEQVEYWCKNAERNGDRIGSKLCLAAAYANLGFVSKASAAFKDAMAEFGEHIPINIGIGLSSGAYGVVLESANRYRRAGGPIGDEEVVMQATKATETLKALGVGEGVLHSMMDQAGAILRKHRLLWSNDAPDMVISGSEGTLFFALNYRVDVSPADAASMNWELAERLAQASLMPDSVAVSFVGCKKSNPL